VLIVENVYNIYGFVIVISVASIMILFTIINRNNNSGGKESIVPEFICITLGFSWFSSLLPFARSHALRLIKTKTRKTLLIFFQEICREED